MNVKNLFLYLLPDIQVKKQILEREYRYKNMNIEANYDKWVGGNWCYKEFDNSDLELINYIHKSVGDND